MSSLTITPKALEKVKQAIASQPNKDQIKGLRVGDPL